MTVNSKMELTDRTLVQIAKEIHDFVENMHFDIKDYENFFEKSIDNEKKI